MSNDKRVFRPSASTEIIETNTDCLHRTFEQKRETLTSLIGLLPQTAKKSLNPIFDNWSRHAHKNDSIETSQTEIELFTQLRHELNNAASQGSLHRRDFIKIAGLLMTSGLASLIFPQASNATTPFAFWKKKTAATPAIYPANTGSDPYWDYVVLCMNMDTPTPSTGFTTVFADESHAGKAPTITGSPYANAGAGSSPYSGRTGSLYCAGSDYISFSGVSDWAFGTGNYTVEAWVKLDLSSNNNFVFELRSGGQGTVLDYAWGSWNSYQGNSYGSASGGSSDSGWHHLAVVRSAGTRYLYVDGVNKGGQADSMTYGAFTLNIGSGGFKGAIADLRVYSGIAKYTANFTPSTAPIGLGTANDKYWGYCVLACPFENSLKDMSGLRVAANGSIALSSVQKKYGTASLLGDGVANTGLSVPNSTALQMTHNDDFTIEAWVYPTGSNGTIWDKDGIGGSSYPNYALGMSTSAAGFGCGNSNGNDPSNWTSVNTTGSWANTWNHIAGVKRGTNLYLFINGILVASGSIGSKTFSSAGRVAWVMREGSGSSNSFNGYIDSLRITKGYARYTSNFTPPTASFPVGKDETVDPFWTHTVLAMNMDGLTDLTGRHTASNNSVTLSSTAKRWGTNGASFNGSSSYFSIPHSPDIAFSTMNFTIEAWIQLQSSSGGFIAAMWAPPSPNYGSFYVGVSSTTVYFKMQTASETATYLSATTPVPIGQWTHLAAVFDNTAMRIFINGSLVASGSFTAGAVSNRVQPLEIGRNADGPQSYFTGYIDDFRITKGVARYVNNFTPPTSTFFFPNNARVFLYSGETRSFTVPSGVTSLRYLLMGGGGQGATTFGAGGGSSGFIVYNTIAVTAGDTITISVGNGGQATTLAKNGSTAATANPGGNGVTNGGTGGSGWSGGGQGYYPGGGPSGGIGGSNGENGQTVYGAGGTGSSGQGLTIATLQAFFNNTSLVLGAGNGGSGGSNSAPDGSYVGKGGTGYGAGSGGGRTASRSGGGGGGGLLINGQGPVAASGGDQASSPGNPGFAYIEY